MIDKILNLKSEINSSSLSEGIKTKKIKQYISHLQNSPKDFFELYNRLDSLESDPIKESYSFDKLTNQKIKSVSDELKIKGISVWPQFYPKEKTSALATLANKCLDSTKKWIMSSNDTFSVHKDEELGCEHLGSRRSLLTGRTRTRFINERSEHKSDLVNGLFNDLRINQVGRLLFNAHSFKSYFLFEKLTPSSIPDYWHIDGILDQYKAMILLEDVGEEQGPMFFKPATKDFLGNKLSPMLYSTFAHGRSWGCFPSIDIVDGLGISTYKATGKAGDAIFFDTKHIHRGSICKRGHRLGLVSYLGVETARNQVLRLLGVD